MLSRSSEIHAPTSSEQAYFHIRPRMWIAEGTGANSSAVRAPVLHTGGRRFDSCFAHHLDGRQNRSR